MDILWSVVCPAAPSSKAPAAPARWSPVGTPRPRDRRKGRSSWLSDSKTSASASCGRMKSGPSCLANLSIRAVLWSRTLARTGARTRSLKAVESGCRIATLPGDEGSAAIKAFDFGLLRACESAPGSRRRSAFSVLVVLVLSPPTLPYASRWTAQTPLSSRPPRSALTSASRSRHRMPSSRRATAARRRRARSLVPVRLPLRSPLPPSLAACDLPVRRRLRSDKLACWL